MKTKHFTKYVVLLLACCAMLGCKPEEKEKYGTIYGTVTDFATGEPISNVNVHLNPRGETSLTGMDGTFEFVDLPNGSYSLSLSKNGYVDLDDDYVIKIENGISVSRDVQMQKELSSLKIIDNNGNPVSILDFGYDAGVNQKTFSVFNDGNLALEFTITKTTNWIDEIVPSTGTVGVGDTKPIYVIIERDLLVDGVNNSNLLITTPTTGGVELPVKATKYGVPKVTTGNVTNITHKSASCTGDVVSGGGSTVSTRGICWSTSPGPTVNDFTATSGSGTGLFSCEMNDLQNNTTYYVRAFARNSSGYSYGEQETFNTDVLPTFQYGGYTYYVAPDPGNDMNWYNANNYCNNLTIYGILGWRMPTLYELEQMYADKYSIGGFSNTRYWSSTYVSVEGWYDYYHLSFENGYVGNGGNSRVRPIRKKN